MQRFWKWGVRNPAVLGIALSIGAGMAGIFDLALGLSLACGFGFVAKMADAFYRGYLRRARRQAVVIELEAARQRLVQRPAARERSGRKAA
jgi:hypothetical protein